MCISLVVIIFLTHVQTAVDPKDYYLLDKDHTFLLKINYSITFLAFTINVGSWLAVLLYLCFSQLQNETKIILRKQFLYFTVILVFESSSVVACIYDFFQLALSKNNEYQWV